MTDETRWYLTTDGEHDLIINDEVANLLVEVEPSIILDNEFEVRELERMFMKGDVDAIDDYLEVSYNYDKDEPLSFDEGLMFYEEVKGHIERGLLYLLEEKRIATFDDLESWVLYWGISNERSELISYEYGEEVIPVAFDQDDHAQVFKSLTEETYYTWNVAGVNWEVLVVEDDVEMIELIQVPKGIAIKRIAKRYGLTITYGDYQYFTARGGTFNFEYQPQFETPTGESIWITQPTVYNGFATVVSRNIPELLEEVRSVVA